MDKRRLWIFGQARSAGTWRMTLVAATMLALHGPLWGQQWSPGNSGSIYYNGNVGIGTPNPLSQLVVSPDASVTGTVVTQAGLGLNAITLQGSGASLNSKSGIVASWAGASPGIASGLVFGRYGSYWGTYIGFHTHSDSYTEPLDQFVERMRIDGSGNVGIGTPNPLSQLVVSPDASVTGTVVTQAGLGLNAITLQGSGASLNSKSGIVASWAGASPGIASGLVFGRYGSYWGTYIGFHTHSDNPTAPLDEFVERMRIDGSGNVGIGTSNPAHLLHVAGTIGAEEVIVSSTGADYVFNPDYRLAPLTEVAGYIKEHHHLPDVPSAPEVQEKGLSLGDMQAKLLAKIEELTLHMIEAEQRRERLEERSDRLEQENRDLADRLRSVEASSIHATTIAEARANEEEGR